MRDVVNILKEVVEGLTQTVPITAVTAGVGTYTFAVDRTYWARPASQKSLATVVTINGEEYDITSMVYNTSITVTTTDNLSAATELSIAAPYWVNGSRLAANNERRDNSWNQCPFVWLVEPFPSNETKDEMSIIESTPDVVMLFLDNVNAQDWDVADQMENVVTPMRELAHAFGKALRDTRDKVGRIPSWRSVRWNRFGSESANGAISSILNESTGGLEVRFTVEILKELTTCE